jgi:hypothetical protein
MNIPGPVHVSASRRNRDRATIPSRTMFSWTSELADFLYKSIKILIDTVRLNSQGTYNAFEIITLRALRRSFSELKHDHNVFQAALLVFIFPDARHVLKRVQQHLLRPQADDKTAMEEAMALKKSLTDDCSMLAVAVRTRILRLMQFRRGGFHADCHNSKAAIVAQVAITALSLDQLSAAHWTARAAFVVSLAAGALSVFFACLLQRRLSSLFGLADLKDWLSTPADNHELKEAYLFVRTYTHARLELQAIAEPTSEKVPWKDFEKQIMDLVNKKRWVRASVNAALMIKMPALLLNWSVAAFLIGLGVYLGSFWVRDLDSHLARRSSLGVLVAYIAVTAVGLLLFFVPMVLKYLEGAPIRRLFDRLKEQAKPADEPSRLTINDFFTQLVGDPDRADSAKLEGNKRDLEGTTCNPLVAAAPLVTCIAQNNDRDQVKDANGIEGVETHRDTNVQASPKLPNEQPHADADHTTELPIMRRPTMASHTYTDPLMATLAASIVAHERSVASFRDLLQEHQRPRRILRHISG